MRLTSNRYEYDRPSELTLSNVKIIGFYSLDGDGEYKDDHSELKYIQYKHTNQNGVRIDLNENINERKKSKLHSMEVTKACSRLSPCLKYFYKHRKQFDVFSRTPITMDKVPFVSGRGTLVKIAKHPYERFDAMRFSVIFANGVIYIRNIDTLKDIRDKEQMTARNKIMSAWGYKFEQCISSDDFDNDPDFLSPVNEVREFNCIIKSSIGKHNIIYRSEMDGILIDEHSEKEEFTNHEEFVKYLNKQKHMEIKTSQIINESNHRDLHKFGHKCLRWWVQSTLGGVESVVCGFRNDDGIVSEVKSFETKSLPIHANMNQTLWNTRTCVNFLDSFLTYVKDILKTKLSEQGYNIERCDDVKTCPVVKFVLHCEVNGDVFVDKPLPGEDTEILVKWLLNKLEKK